MEKESPSDGLLFTLFFRMHKLPNIEQRRQKSDIPPLSWPLRRHSWAWMVSFPRRRGNKNAHLVHPYVQMRVFRHWMVKWHTSPGTRGQCDSTGVFSLSSFLLSLPEEYSSEELQWVLRVLPHSNHMHCSLLWHRLRKNWTLIIWK